MLLILGVLLFVMLVIVHELGHFWAARRSGVEVEEFGLGFPPRITGKKFKPDGTFYSVNWLPLGGFVKLKGEHDADTEPGSYGAASFKQKTFIILAGIGMNLVAAAVILTILSWVGLPRLIDGQFTLASDTKISDQSVLISYVEPESPAGLAGIEPGDRLHYLGDKAITSAEEVAPTTESLAGQTVQVMYERAGELESTEVTLEVEDEGDGYLGVQPADYIVEQSTWSAPLRGIGLTAQFSWLTLQGVVTTLADLVQGQGSEAAQNVAGPVGVAVLLSDVSQAGWVMLLFFIALISVTLAVVNVLPIPALDGGRLFVSGLFKVLKKPLNAATEERIHATGMALLLGLIVLITIVDVRRFF